MDGQGRPLHRLLRRSMGEERIEGRDCKRVFPALLPKQSTARLHKADARIF